MTEKPKKKPVPVWAVYLTIILVGFFALIFILEFWVASTAAPGSADVLTEQTYMTEVEPLLSDGDPERGRILIEETYECATCHIQGSERIAPNYVGLKERAAERRSPLSAEAYVYESILYPAAYIVEGYQNAMPANYLERLSDEELGDILAYLLSQ